MMNSPKPLIFAMTGIALAAGLAISSASFPQTEAPAKVAEPAPTVISEIRTTAAKQRILYQEITLNAPVDKVWEAYTTDAGWTAWASPKAKIDLRVGGTIRTQYDPKAEIGDPGTNTLHIVNYAPKELLTLRADLTDNWPEVMKKDADNLSNVILFDELGPKQTRIRSYGMGYGTDPEYDKLLGFFITGNEGLLKKLKQVVEAK